MNSRGEKILEEILDDQKNEVYRLKNRGIKVYSKDERSVKGLFIPVEQSHHKSTTDSALFFLAFYKLSQDEQRFLDAPQLSSL